MFHFALWGHSNIMSQENILRIIWSRVKIRKNRNFYQREIYKQLPSAFDVFTFKNRSFYRRRRNFAFSMVKFSIVSFTSFPQH